MTSPVSDASQNPTMSISHTLALEIISKGAFYSPAAKHYPSIMRANVHCDLCLRENIPVCVGWGEKDLCMRCVERITSGPMGVTGLSGLPDIPNPFRSGVTTRMMQDSVRRPGEPTTLMMQESARRLPMSPTTNMMQDSARRSAPAPAGWGTPNPVDVERAMTNMMQVPVAAMMQNSARRSAPVGPATFMMHDSAIRSAIVYPVTTKMMQDSATGSTAINICDPVAGSDWNTTTDMMADRCRK